MLSCLTCTHVFKQRLFSGSEQTILTQNLPILPFTMELVAITCMTLFSLSNVVFFHMLHMFCKIFKKSTFLTQNLPILHMF